MSDAPAAPAVAKLWSVERLSKHWSMKADSIRAMVRRGQLPAVRIGRCVYFEETALVAFLEQRKAS
jgi:excisionase family DNA binding protein